MIKQNRNAPWNHIPNLFQQVDIARVSIYKLIYDTNLSSDTSVFFALIQEREIRFVQSMSRFLLLLLTKRAKSKSPLAMCGWRMCVIDE